MAGTALVLGATGGIGGEVARSLLRRGWHVRALARTVRPGADGRIEWVRGDALIRDDVVNAAAGASVIVHAVNPPGYRDWDRLVLPMIDNSIAAALATGARIALPGTIYNYDLLALTTVAPDAPQAPRTRKGRIRAELERRLEHSGARVLILRAGDFFGPRPGGNWLSQGMIAPGKPVTKVTSPAFPGVGHAWAYLPDVAEAFARLLGRDDLPRFARHHFAGHWDADGMQFATAVAKAGEKGAKVVRLPWRVLPMVGLFNATIRELMEMRCFWQHPLRLDNRTLVEAIGEEPHTPLNVALETTLDALGCRGTTSGLAGQLAGV